MILAATEERVVKYIGLVLLLILPAAVRADSIGTVSGVMTITGNAGVQEVLDISFNDKWLNIDQPLPVLETFNLNVSSSGPLPPFVLTNASGSFVDYYLELLNSGGDEIDLLMPMSNYLYKYVLSGDAADLQFSSSELYFCKSEACIANFTNGTPELNQMGGTFVEDDPVGTPEPSTSLLLLPGLFALLFSQRRLLKLLNHSSGN